MHHLIIRQLTLTIKIVNKSEFGTLSKSLGTEPINSVGVQIFEHSELKCMNVEISHSFMFYIKLYIGIIYGTAQH